VVGAVASAAVGVASSLIAGTHIAFSTALYLGGAALFEHKPDLVGWALSAGASLLPDVDLPTSKLGRALFWLSTRLERRYGHRTLTHSALAVGSIALLASPLLLWHRAWFWCVVGGYWSHLWIDMLNIRGSDLLWPSPVRVVMPGNRKHRLEVGSKGEMVLLTSLLVACLALYPISGMGFRGGLQHLLGNFDMARDAYAKQAGSHWYTLDLEATDHLTLERIHCQCPVLGIWQNGLIVLHQGKPRAVGESERHHNLYPLHSRLIEGEPLQVLSERIDMRGRSLRWLLDRLDPQRTYYLLGEIQLAESARELTDLDRYHPATFSGKVLRLHYAREAELVPYLHMPAAQGEVYVQFWLKPGDPPVELSLGDEGKEEVIPAALRGYLGG